MQPARYHCDHHGANRIHGTRNCLVLNGNQGSTCKDRMTQHKRTMIAANTFMISQPHRWDECRQQLARQEREARADRPQCMYCEKYGYGEDQWVMLHLELAEPGLLPPGAMQRSMFLENKAKGAGRVRPNHNSNGRSICSNPRAIKNQAARAALNHGEQTLPHASRWTPTSRMRITYPLTTTA